MRQVTLAPPACRSHRHRGRASTGYPSIADSIEHSGPCCAATGPARLPPHLLGPKVDLAEGEDQRAHGAAADGRQRGQLLQGGDLCRHRRRHAAAQDRVVVGGLQLRGKGGSQGWVVRSSDGSTEAGGRSGAVASSGEQGAPTLSSCVSCTASTEALRGPSDSSASSPNPPPTDMVVSRLQVRQGAVVIAGKLSAAGCGDRLAAAAAAPAWPHLPSSCCPSSAWQPGSSRCTAQWPDSTT
jgi:hypothetical protein